MLASSSSARTLLRQPSASDLASGGTTQSPLDALSLSLPGPSRYALKPSTPPPVPALDLNLFRSSIYSVSSNDGTVSGDDRSPSTSPPAVVHALPPHIARVIDEDGDDEDDSPSTPRASRTSYFPPARPPAPPPKDNPEASSSLALTPKRSFVVRSRDAAAGPPPPTSAVTREPFALRAVPGRLPCTSSDYAEQQRGAAGSSHAPRTASEPFARAAPVHHAEPTSLDADLASVHGEQGSAWGEAEADFEWLDTDGALEAPNGDGRGGRGAGAASPSKRLSRIRAAVTPSLGALTAPHHGSLHRAESSRRLRRPLVFPKRAAPPPPPVAPSPAPIGLASPSKKASSSSSHISHPAPLHHSDASRPPRLALSPRWNSGNIPPPAAADVFGSARSLSMPDPQLSPAGSPLPSPLAAAALPPRSTTLAPTMVPMKDDDGSPGARPGVGGRVPSRQSHLSVQSMAYSFYDLDASSPSTPGATTPTGGRDASFPRGTYTKVSASALERARGPSPLAPTRAQARDRTASEPARASELEPDDMVAAGIEAKARGDLPKSAWLFMKAAERGSTAGRIYWGLALRHGWGIAKDEKRAFAELLQACDLSLAAGGLDFAQSPRAVKLTARQQRTVTTDLSVGLFEVANCFLNGVGTKRTPDAALQYLRMAALLGDTASQEQLGLLLSKGGSGVKKDMREAAKWYRVAGSANTFGLAWVWKEKYNE